MMVAAPPLIVIPLNQRALASISSIGTDRADLVHPWSGATPIDPYNSYSTVLRSHFDSTIDDKVGLRLELPVDTLESDAVRCTLNTRGVQFENLICWVAAMKIYGNGSDRFCFSQSSVHTVNGINLLAPLNRAE